MGDLGLTSEILMGLLASALLLCAAGALYQRAGATRDARRFPPPGRLIEIGGTRLHIDIRGGVCGGSEGEASPPVVFEAGIAATSLSWQRVQPEIARLTQTASYDRAGLGWSDAAGDVKNEGTQRGIWQVVEDLRRLLDSASIATPRIFVGHSYGGLVVTAYAMRYPAEVAGLILVDPVAAGEWSDPLSPARRRLKLGIRLSRRGALLARFGAPRVALHLLSRGRRLLPMWIARATSGPGAGLIDRVVGQIQKLPRELWPMIQSHWCDPKSFEGMARYLEALPESAAAVNREFAADLDKEILGAIPLIVLSSANASATERAEHEMLARRSSRGRCEIVPGSGHWIQIDSPEAVIRAIEEMVSKCRS
jgi:pimeloyl-ACP methyl ester carboxylesterase